MPGITRLGDISTGHDAYPARPNDEASDNIKVNGIAVHRVGDHWEPHTRTVLPFDTHDGVLAEGSDNIKANGKYIGRIGDPISDGDTVATGSDNIKAN